MKVGRWLSQEERLKREELILKLKRQGLNNVQIGVRVGISTSQVWKIISDASKRSVMK